MKILLLAPNDGHSHVYIREAFQDLGHEVREVDYRAIGQLRGLQTLHDYILRFCAGYDLTLILKGEMIAPGIIRQIKNCAVWDFDCWDCNAEWYIERAKAAKWFFTPCKGLVPKFREMSINAQFLLEGCSPKFHYPEPLVWEQQDWHMYASDVSFVGTIENIEGRREWLTAVAEFVYNNELGKMHLWGSFGGAPIPYAQHNGRPVGEDSGLNKVATNTKINLDYSRRPDIDGGFSARIFRTLAARGFLLMRKVEGIEEMLQPGVDLDVFESTEECIEKIRFYLDDEEARKRVADNGYRKVLAEHTFVKRLTEMLKVIDYGK